MDFICPVCSVITDSSETAQATIDSHITPITDSTHTAMPSAVSDAHSYVVFGLSSFSEMPPPSFLWNGTIEGSDFVYCVMMRLFIEEIYLWSFLEKLGRNLCRSWHACFILMGRSLHWDVLL